MSNYDNANYHYYNDQFFYGNIGCNSPSHMRSISSKQNSKSILLSGDTGISSLAVTNRGSTSGSAYAAAGGSGSPNGSSFIFGREQTTLVETVELVPPAEVFDTEDHDIMLINPIAAGND